MQFRIIFFTLFLTLNAGFLFAQPALSDSYTIPVNNATVLDVRANDNYSSVDFITVPYQSETGLVYFPPQHGDIFFLNNYSIMYVPDSGYTGQDDFVYGIAYYDKYYYSIDTARVFLTVYAPDTANCQVAFTYNMNPSSGEVGFQGSTLDPVPGTATYHWVFSDNTTGSVSNPVHYFQPGTHTACLTVETAQGCTDTYCDTVVMPVFCQARYSATTGNCLNCYEFQDNSQGNIITWEWNFGDGENAVDTNPVHTFLLPGAYEVCLKIITSDNCSSVYCETIQANEHDSCNAVFTFTSTINNTVSFNDNSTGTIATWSWNFGDDSVSQSQNPAHSYRSTGHYLTCLTITTARACSSSICKDIQIIQPLVDSVIYFGGLVWAENNLLPEGVAVLFDIAHNYKAVAWNYIYNGIWLLSAPPGNYLVYAIPEYDYQLSWNKMYLPTYLGDKLHWQDATVLNFNNDSVNMDIHLASAENLSQFYGDGTVNGNVYYTCDSTYENDIFGIDWFNDTCSDDYSLTRSNAAMNMPVLLLDENNIPVKFMLSENSGSFNFDNLAYKNYKIFTEKAGMTTFPLNISIDGQHPEIGGISVFIGSTNITSGIDNKPVAPPEYIINAYPVPVTDVLHLNIGLEKDELIEMAVSDISGKLLYAVSSDFTKGKNKAEIDTRNLGHGVYFIKITCSDGRYFVSEFVK